MTETLATIGYERAAMEDFLAALRLAGVRVLVDVRAVAASRRKGFSKTALAEALATAGIDYVHLQALGNPKAGREAARAGDIDTYLNIYTLHLQSEAAEAALDEAAGIAAAGGACLMCYERDAAGCHRSMVSAELCARGDFEVSDLTIESAYPSKP